MATPDAISELRNQLLALLKGGQAHTTFDQAASDLPFDLQGKTPSGLPYSPWELLEHLRITLHDILTFSDNADGKYQPLEWPKEYWPASTSPPDESAWQKTVNAYSSDLKVFEKLVAERDLTEPFAWDKKKNLLREALLVADHAAYHVGELIVLRRLLGEWEPS